MPNTTEPARTRSTDWSLVYICLGLSALAAFALTETILLIVLPGFHLLPQPLRLVIYTGLIVLVATATIVRVVSRRLDDGEQRLARLIDASYGMKYAEGFADGAAGRPAAPVMRLARDLRPDR